MAYERASNRGTGWYYNENDADLVYTMTESLEELIKDYAKIPVNDEETRSRKMYYIRNTVKMLVSHAFTDGWSDGYFDRGKELSELINTVLDTKA